MKKQFLKKPAIILFLTSMIMLAYNVAFMAVNGMSGGTMAASFMKNLLSNLIYVVMGAVAYLASVQPGREALDENQKSIILWGSGILGAWSLIGFVSDLVRAIQQDTWIMLTILFGSILSLCSFARMISCFMLLMQILSKKTNKPAKNILLWVLIVVYALLCVMYMFVASGEDAGSNAIALIMMIIIAFVVYYFAYAKPTAHKIERMTAEQLKEYNAQKAKSLGLPIIYLLCAGIVCLFGAFIVRPRIQAPAFAAFGIGLAGLGALMAYGKKRKWKVKTYQIVDIPSHWPTDCFREDYVSGIRNNVEKPIQSSELSFYNACREAGVSNIHSESGMAKAELVAQRMKIKEDILTYYETGASHAEANQKLQNQNKNDDSLREIRIKEFELLKKTLQYYGLHGSEKRKAMLQQLIKQCKEDQKQAAFAQQCVRNTTQQKELDWAVAGGMASGLAGFGAGVATALDIQAKNAEIREQNQRNLPLTLAGVAYYSRQEKDALARMKVLNKEMDNLPNKLIGKEDSSSVFAHLIISDPVCATTESGAVVVEATFCVDEEYMIYGDISPVIDGCVAARILDGDQMVGSAYFVFPLYGVKEPTRIQAICTRVKDEKVNYSIRFEAVDLWAMEK